MFETDFALGEVALVAGKLVYIGQFTGESFESFENYARYVFVGAIINSSAYSFAPKEMTPLKVVKTGTCFFASRLGNISIQFSGDFRSVHPESRSCSAGRAVRFCMFDNNMEMLISTDVPTFDDVALAAKVAAQFRTEKKIIKENHGARIFRLETEVAKLNRELAERLRMVFPMTPPPSCGDGLWKMTGSSFGPASGGGFGSGGFCSGGFGVSNGMSSRPGLGGSVLGGIGGSQFGAGGPL